MAEAAYDLGGLSPQRKLELIEELWESLDEATRDSIPLTEEQRAELDRRLDVFEVGEQVRVPAKDLHARLRAEFLYHLEALREIPSDLIIPPRITVSKATMEGIADLLERPPRPTAAMCALMSGR